jgi:DNA-binding LacI/PurR family transcriptional regulator
MWDLGKKITSTDIARFANVHQSTVSRALNPEMAWQVSPEKREEIRALCRKYGVMPSRAARRRGRTGRIALILGNMARDLCDIGRSMEIQRMCDIFQNNGYTLDLIRLDWRSGRQVSVMRRILSSWQADVYIVSGVLLNGQSLDLLRETSSRLIVTLGEDMDQIPYPDHRWLSYFSIESSGAYEEAFAAIPPEHRRKMLYFGRKNFASACKIKRIRALISRNVGVPDAFESLFFAAEGNLPPIEIQRRAARTVRENAGQLKCFSSFWCGGDSAAFLYDELLRAGRTPGRDFTIIAHGVCGRLLEPPEPGINLICRNVDQVAEKLCEYALHLVDAPSPGRLVQKLVFHPARYDLLKEDPAGDGAADGKAGDGPGSPVPDGVCAGGKMKTTSRRRKPDASKKKQIYWRCV